MKDQVLPEGSGSANGNGGSRFSRALSGERDLQGLPRLDARYSRCGVSLYAIKKMGKLQFDPVSKSREMVARFITNSNSMRHELQIDHALCSHNLHPEIATPRVRIGKNPPRLDTGYDSVFEVYQCKGLILHIETSRRKEPASLLAENPLSR